MCKKIVLILLGTLAISTPFSAIAKPQIEINTISEKEIIAIIDGKETIKIVPATDVEPRQNLIFRLQYANNGDEKATNVVINNPVPKDTTYLPGTAYGEKSDITFSVDEGKAFKKPSMLTYEVKGSDGKPVTKKASPEHYTDIRWTIQEIPAAGHGEVGFKVKVK